MRRSLICVAALLASASGFRQLARPHATRGHGHYTSPLLRPTSLPRRCDLSARIGAVAAMAAEDDDGVPKQPASVAAWKPLALSGAGGVAAALLVSGGARAAFVLRGLGLALPIW